MVAEYFEGRDKILGFDAKVNRLLDTAAVTIVHRDDHYVAAIVEGDHGTYSVECDEVGWWRCSCPAWGRRCTHIAAVRKVVGLDRRWPR